MIGPKALSRRTLLRGTGAAVALPLLEAMLPKTAMAAAAQPSAPARLAIFFTPNGVHMPAWKPTKEGSDFELPAILKHLEPHREHLTVLSNLTLDGARAGKDGAGDHARSSGVFLTCQRVLKTGGANMRAAVSMDQVLASRIGEKTRFESLELSLEHGSLAGSCDSGYACSYSNTVSWKTPTTPVPREVDPRQLFERLFSGADANAGKRRELAKRYRKSVLDFVKDDASAVNGKLGKTDQRKLDEYLTSIRDVERRLDHVEVGGGAKSLKLPKAPPGIPGDFAEHYKVMSDLLALAFQADLTRVATFMVANEGSNRPYRTIGVNEGHHELSHHGRDRLKQEKIQKINEYHMAQFSKFLERMKGIDEGGRSLLDNSMIVVGSGIGDGDRHNHDDLPVILLGGAGGTIRGNRHLTFKNETPLANLWVDLMNRMGVQVDRFGDSTGRLHGLS